MTANPTHYRLSYSCPLKQFKLNIPRLLSFMESRKRTYVQAASKNINVGIHLDIYEPSWFKLSMMIDTTELYILMLVSLTLTMIQAHRVARKKKNFCASYLPRLWMDVGGVGTLLRLVSQWMSFSCYLAWSVFFVLCIPSYASGFTILVRFWHMWMFLCVFFNPPIEVVTFCLLFCCWHSLV